MEFALKSSKLSLSKTILFSALKTTGICIVSFFMIIAICVPICPSNIFLLCNNLDMKNVSIAGFEYVYNKSDDIADLYNLVQVCSKYKDYDRLSKLTNTMLAKLYDDDSFLTQIDNQAIAIAPKNTVAFVCSYENFVRNKRVEAYFYLNNITYARYYAGYSLCDDFIIYNPRVCQIPVFVNLIMASNLTVLQKCQQFYELYSTVFSISTFTELMENKIYLIESALSNAKTSSENVVPVIIYTNCKLELLQAWRTILLGVKQLIDVDMVAGIESNITSLNNDISQLQVEYNNLIGD